MAEKKEGSVRKQEILDQSLDLFMEKGYDKTTIEDILEKVGIKKGTFYYYFKAKEDVLETLAWREAEKKLEITKAAAENEKMTAAEKINSIIREAQKINFAGLEKRIGLLKSMGESGNAKLFQKLYDYSLIIGIPILQSIIEQGMKEKVFRTEYPQETALLYVEMMTSLKNTVGKLLLEIKDKEQFKTIVQRKILFYQDTLEKIFQCEKDIIQFAFISMEYIKKI